MAGSTGGKGGQKARKHKISQGLRPSSRPVKLTEVQKILMGGGMASSGHIARQRRLADEQHKSKSNGGAAKPKRTISEQFAEPRLAMSPGTLD